MDANEAIQTQEPLVEGLQALPRRQLVLTVAGVMMAMFLSSLDQTVVGTAMPRIVADLGGFAHYAWVTTAYIVTSTTVIPIVGKMTDILGRKWIYIAGIVIFLVGSVFCGISQSMTQLIVFRAFQGIGGGVMMANAFIVIGDLFPPAERGKYMGLMSGVFGVSAVVGPMIGGFITDNLSWQWVFYVNIPIGIPAVIFFVMFFPHVRPSAVRQPINYLGMVTLVLSVVPLMLALSWGGTDYPWISPQIIGIMAFGVLSGVVFFVVESKAAEPFLPLDLFRNHIVRISMIVTFLTGFGMFGGIIFVPLFFQGVLGASAAASGSFLTPMMLGMVVGSIVSGQVISRTGGHYKIQGLIGLAVTAVGVGLLSRVTEATSHGQAVFDIVLMGLGLGVTMPIFTLAVQNAVPYRIMGVATSSTQFIRMIGGVMGLAILGSLMTSRFAAGFTGVVPAGVKEALQPDQLSEMAHNPQALVSPAAQEQLQAQFDNSMGPQGAGLLQQLLDSMRHALASAIGEVFLWGLIAVLLAFLVTIFLKEVPLKGRGQKAEGESPPPPGRNSG